MIKEKKRLQQYLFVGLAGLILCNAMIVMRGSVEAFHSDSATAILLAREQMRSRQLIPDGWHYANDIWMLSLNLLCIPFMLIFDNWMLCRELAVILQMLLVTGLLIHFVCRIVDIQWALIAAILFWCPISVVAREHFLYQATYATGMLQTLLVLLAVYGFFYKNTKKSDLVNGVFLGAVTAVMAAAGIRFIGATVLPLAGAIIMMILLETDFNLLKIKETPYRQLVIKLIYFLVVSCIGYGIHLKIRSGGAISEFSMRFINSDELLEKLSSLIYYYLSIWGCLDATGVLSFTGVVSFCGFILCIVMNVAVPVYLVVRFRHIQNKTAKVFIIYSWLMGIVLNYLVTFTNMCNNYYLLPVFFNSCILSAIALADLFSIKKNLSAFLAVVCIVPFCFVTGLYWGTRNYSKGEAERELIQMLEEEDLHFGCTGIFWDAYRFTVLSDGGVEIVSYTDQPEMPQLWLSSEKWYEPEYYEGKSFILVRNGWTELDEKWKERAEEVIVWREFTIYVYPENIYKMMEEER